MTLNKDSSRSSKVKGYMLPFGSPLVVSYVTSIVSNIVSLTTFKIFDVQVLSPRSMTVQGHSRSKFTVPIDSAWLVSYSTSIDPIVASVSVFEIFDIKAILPQEQW